MTLIDFCKDIKCLLVYYSGWNVLKGSDFDYFNILVMLICNQNYSENFKFMILHKIIQHFFLGQNVKNLFTIFLSERYKIILDFYLKKCQNLSDKMVCLKCYMLFESCIYASFTIVYLFFYRF